MRIELKKFGTTLISRQAGKEALAAFQPSLATLSDTETVTISFQGVTTFSPSWGDEFLHPLSQTFGKRLVLERSENLSVIATLDFLEEIHGLRFQRETAR